jgi:hypothetical protein
MHDPSLQREERERRTWAPHVARIERERDTELGRLAEDDPRRAAVKTEFDRAYAHMYKIIALKHDGMGSALYWARVEGAPLREKIIVDLLTEMDRLLGNVPGVSAQLHH